MSIEIKVFPSASYCLSSSTSVIGRGFAKTCIILNNNKNVMKYANRPISVFEYNILKYSNFTLNKEVYTQMRKVMSDYAILPQFYWEWLFWNVILHKNNDKKYFTPIISFGLYPIQSDLHPEEFSENPYSEDVLSKYLSSAQIHSDVEKMSNFKPFSICPYVRHQYCADSKLEKRLLNISSKYNLRDVDGRIGSNVFVTQKDQFKIIDYGIPTRW
jgi:hypothetical protein